MNIPFTYLAPAVGIIVLGYILYRIRTNTKGKPHQSGSYDFDVPYTTPNGHTEKIHLHIDLDGEKITDIKFDHREASNEVSEERLASFVQYFDAKEYIGKNINELDISRIGGSSLTTGAFKKAIRKIDEQSVKAYTE